MSHEIINKNKICPNIAYINNILYKINMRTKWFYPNNINIKEISQHD
jgi:hypothetical protein